MRSFFTRSAHVMVLVPLLFAVTRPCTSLAQKATRVRRDVASPDVSAEDRARLQAALAAYNVGKLDDARPVLLDLAQRHPKLLDAQSAAGMLLAEQGQIDAALPYLERAHQLAPADAPVALNLSIAYLKLSRNAEAEPLLVQLCRRDPANAVSRYALAQAQLAQKQYGEAAAGFEQAKELARPSDGIDADDLRYNWALALLGENKAERARQVLAEAPDARDSATIQGMLGEIDEKRGDYEGAFGHCKRAAELDPSEANLNAYGSELLQHWSFGPAIEIYKFASGRYPASTRLKTGLGVAYFGNNNFAEAAQVFQSMLAADPENASYADMLGRSCAARTGSADADCGGLLAFAKRHPENATASLYAAIFLLRQASEGANNAEAEALLRSALKTDPRLPDAWYQLAVLQQGRSEWQASEDSLQHAIALRPAFPEAHYRLSRAYSHTGKREAAQQQIALQQQYVEEAKQADAKRMKEVITFLTTSN